MSKWTRRDFMKAGGVGLAASAAPFFIPKAGGASANETVNVAVVGVGGRGSGLANNFAKLSHSRLAALCDVDPQRQDKTAQEVSDQDKVKKYADYRKLVEDKDIDAVVIATCDHWHTPVALAAILNGKHVYVEKPSSHTVHEANLLIQAARQYKKCVQHGTQRRSSSGFMAAVKALKEGVIGNVYMAKAYNQQRRGKIGHAEPADPPPGVDYDMWLGPAPKVPFTRHRWHYQWHWFWDYGGGDIVNDGIHHLDLAIWGMGLDQQYPDQIVTSGGQLWYDDDHETPDTQTIVYVYPKVQVLYEMRLWTPYAVGGYGNATVFYGTDGYLEGTTAVRGDEKIQIRPEDYGVSAEGNTQNFITAVRHDDPSLLNAPIEIGGVSANLCNLGNIGTRLGNAALTYDAHSRSITRCSADLESANALLTKEYRRPYSLPYTG
jgi:predicted dehydrogenase